MQAILALNTSLAKLLLTMPELDIHKRDNLHKTALHHAIYVQNTEIAQHLFARGAHIDGRNILDIDYHRLIGHTLLKTVNSDMLNNIINDYGMTLLMEAVSIRNANIVKLLLAVPTIDIHKKDFLGKTALHYAINVNDAEIARLLIARGARIGKGPLRASYKERLERLLSHIKTT